MRWRDAVRTGVGLVGLLVAVAGIGTVLSPATAVVISGTGAPDRSMAWLMVGAAAALVLAGSVAWIARPGSGLAPLSFWAAAAWLAPELVVSGSVTREAWTLGLLLTPLLAPLLVHLPVRAIRADRGRVRLVVVAMYVAFLVVAVGRAVTWDPFVVIACDPRCHPDQNLLLLRTDIPASLAFRDAGWWLTLLAAIGLAGWAASRLWRRSDPNERVVLLPAAVTGVALAGWAWARLVTPESASTELWAVRTTGLLGAAIIALGSGVAFARLREQQRAAAVRDLVELLDAGAGARPLAETLATVLHDPTVRIAYPFEGGFINDLGGPAPQPAQGNGRGVTPIERDRALVALVEHDAALDPDLLARQIGQAARLAVDNERLGAVLRAQVRELVASRRRLVAEGDAARDRLERDLHDTAQQRMIAVSYELRVAAASATAGAVGQQLPPGIGPTLTAAIDEADATLAELRTLAHGIWPAVLAESGLDTALRSLAVDAAIPVTVAPVRDERFSTAIEAAAYLAVAEALRRAVAGGAGSLAVRAERVEDRLEVEARAPALVAPGPWLRVADRVGAAGGRCSVTSDASIGTLLRVDLPCA